MKNKESEGEMNSTIYNNLAILYAKIGFQEKARDYFLKAIDLRKKENILDEKLPSFYHNLAKLYENAKEYKEAISCYLKNIEILKELSNKSSFYNEKLASSYDSIAKLYIENDDYNSAIESYLKEIKILKGVKSSNSEIKLINIYLSIIKICPSDNSKLLDHYMEIIDLLLHNTSLNEKKRKYDLAHIYMLIGNYYNNLRKYDLAKEYYLKNIKIREELKEEDYLFNSNLLIVSYLHLLSLYYKIDDKNSAYLTKNKLSKIVNSF